MYYLDQQKLADALEYAKKSEDYSLLAKNKGRLGIAYMGLAETYSMMKDTINANHYFEKSMELETEGSSAQSKAWILTNWAKLKPTEEALKMRLQANDFWKEIGTNSMYLHNSGMIGVLYLEKYHKENDPHKKRDYLNTAEQYLTSTIENSEKDEDIINSIEFTKAISDLYSEKKQYDKAYFYLEKSMVLNDSLNSQEIKNSLAKLESQKEIELRDKEIEVNELKLESQKRQQVFLLSGISLFAIIGGLLFYQSRTRRKNNQKLRLLNQELDESNKIKTRFFGILNHDLRSPVSNLIHFLHLQREDNELLTELDKEKFQRKTITAAENLLISMEDILLWGKGQMDNFKPQFEKIAVSSLFTDISNHFVSEDTIKFQFENPDNLYLVTDDNYLKTIMRNLTNNAIKAIGETAEASIVWKATRENGQPQLSITDNGSGGSQEKFKALFDDTEVVGIKTGLGLHLIRDLAKAINCEISVNSELDQGTTVSIYFPKYKKT